MSLLYFAGFINFKTKREFSVIKEIIGSNAHVEGARGTDFDNEAYCSKQCVGWRFGEPVGQGRRTDLEAVVKRIEGGDSLVEVAKQCPTEFIKYSRGIERLHTLLACNTVRDWKTEVTVLWGPTGTGKSYKASALAKSGEGVYYKPRGPWFDGFNGQHTVIIDDFYGWIKYDEMLRICDRYPHKVEIKGAFIEFTARHIIITSNSSPNKWWKGEWYNEETYKALYRRLDNIFYCDVIDNEYVQINQKNDVLNETINFILN